MKILSAILFALFAVAATGEEKSPAKAAPQPRVRLDPVSRAAVALPAAQVKEAKPSVVMMDKYVVQDGDAVSKGPTHPAEQNGRFSALNGGYVLTGAVGKAQWEIGAWPWLPWTDVMADDITKFPKPKTLVDINIARLRW